MSGIIQKAKVYLYFLQKTATILEVTRFQLFKYIFTVADESRTVFNEDKHINRRTQ